jgi:hypothetical protein
VDLMHPPMPPLPPPPPHSRPPLRFQPSHYIDRFPGDHQEHPAPTSPRSATDDGDSNTTTTDIDDPSSDDSFLSDDDSVHLRPSSVDPPPGQSQSQGSPPPRHNSRRSGSVTAQSRSRSPPPPYMSRPRGVHQSSPASAETNTARNTAMSLLISTRNTHLTDLVSNSAPSHPLPGPSPGPSHHPISPPPPPYTRRPFGHRREHSAPIARLLSRPY